MTVLRSVTVEEFFVDVGTLVVRDQGQAVDDAGAGLEEDRTSLSVTGRVALAGAGWLHAHARSGAAQVTLELLDRAPDEADVQGGWLMETPYLSSSGRVALDSLVPSADGAGLDLGSSGRFRVRVHVHEAEAEDRTPCSSGGCRSGPTRRTPDPCG